jgi:dethiobiotin synthetase
MEKGYFITGTDTNVGKTWATVALMRYFKGQAKSVIGLKPVASGCTFLNGLLVNDDALLLQENSTMKLDYQVVNPYAFELPVPPHIAGKVNPVDLNVIVNGFNAIKDQAQIILAEGAGGWHSPLNENQDNCDLAVALNLPVLLVVAIKLGCINHAQLSHQAILKSGAQCAGWIAVCLDPELLCIKENIDTLKKRLGSHFCGALPYTKTQDFDLLAKCYTF